MFVSARRLQPQQLEIVDYGKAPIARVGGLARVEHLGSNVLFALWAMQTVIVDGRVLETPEVTQNVLFPVTEVGPAIELTISSIGPRMIWPASSHFARRLLG